MKFKMVCVNERCHFRGKVSEVEVSVQNTVLCFPQFLCVGCLNHLPLPIPDPEELKALPQ
jgi:hypothetical protein